MIMTVFDKTVGNHDFMDLYKLYYTVYLKTRRKIMRYNIQI